MAEVRVDPLGGRRVVIADDRGERPGAFNDVSPHPSIDSAKDPFAEGNEDQTPPELWALRPNGGPANSRGWLVRAVPNLYPAFSTDPADLPAEPNPDLFGSRPARGNHEVVISSPRSVTSLSELSIDELSMTVDGWCQRLAVHADAAIRHLFVNEGSQAGASLPHSHAQLIATDFVPRLVAAEREAFHAHAGRTNGSNLLSDILMEEVRRRERIVAIDERSVLLAPWASAVAFQLMIVPRDASADFAESGHSAAPMIHLALSLLKQRFGAPPPMNLWVRSAPAGADQWTWRIDILPRLAQPAGIELGVGLGVNPISPERAAAGLRELIGAST